MNGLFDGLALPLLGAAIVVASGVGLIGYATRRRGGSVIKVVGVGSGGANALEAMIRARIRGVEFVAVNTDARALRRSSARKRVEIGKGQTNGLGTGGEAAIGENAARESAEAIARALAGADLVIITAGLGGGTGSGAAPVVADVARQAGALSMAVVTRPFTFEGARRKRVADRAAAVLADKVDAVATIPNDRVREIIPGDATVDDAFKVIDDVVSRSIGEIVHIIAVPGRINLDFADVKAVLQGGGAAVLGVGRASGDNRAAEAVRSAMASTLLEGRMDGATSILLSVSGSSKLKLSELDAVVRTVLASAGPDANLVFGMGLHPSLKDEIQVTIIATGLDSARAGGPSRPIEADERAVAHEPAVAQQPISAREPIPAREPAPAHEPVPAAGPMPPSGGPEEWRPVWLRRSGSGVNQATPTRASGQKSRRAKGTSQPPRPAPDAPDTTSGS